MGKISEQELESRLKECQLLALDFDGVLTDNAVFVDSNGNEMVRCDRYDSIGLGLLRKLGTVKIVIITQEPTQLVPLRAKKLCIDCYGGLGPKEKLPVLQELASRLDIKMEDVCYVGNDLNDLDCLENVGLSIAVADCHPDILGSVHFITQKTGGHGAVREVCDLILKAKGVRK